MNGLASERHRVRSQVYLKTTIQLSSPAISIQDHEVCLPVPLGVRADVLVEPRKCDVPREEGQVGPGEPLTCSSGIVHGLGKQVQTVVDCTKERRDLKCSRIF